ncbi:hypothetical protein GYA49_04865 [Candidatus Beckwithbacteria bacterium]|nr:hypothetical protein [Candidatus Beckwithbacteria bacterium]
MNESLSIALSNQVEKNPDLGTGIRLESIRSKASFIEAQNTGLHPGFLEKAETVVGNISITEGLDFDPNNIRTQGFLLRDEEKIIGTASFAILPRPAIGQQRYFKMSEKGLYICDFSSVGGGEVDFIFMPSWAMLLPEYRSNTGIAIGGFRLFEKIFNIVSDNIPEGRNVWTETTARGMFEDSAFLAKLLASKLVGSFVPFSELPFKPNIVGLARQESVSTVKMARLLGITRINDLSSPFSLGPVFAKQL